jgi:hypothetical protein
MTMPPWPPRPGAGAFAGIAIDVCLAFPAIAALVDGYQTHAEIDASGTSFATLVGQIADAYAAMCARSSR